MTKSMLIPHRAFGPPFEGTATEAQTRVMELQLMVDRLMELQLMVESEFDSPQTNVGLTPL